MSKVTILNFPKPFGQFDHLHISGVFFARELKLSKNCFIVTRGHFVDDADIVDSFHRVTDEVRCHSLFNMEKRIVLLFDESHYKPINKFKF